MAWVLCWACFEVGFTTSLRFATAFGPPRTIAFLVSVAIDVLLICRGQPIGTAYAVGLIGATERCWSHELFGEPTRLRMSISASSLHRRPKLTA